MINSNNNSIHYYQYCCYHCYHHQYYRRHFKQEARHCEQEASLQICPSQPVHYTISPNKATSLRTTSIASRSQCVQHSVGTRQSYVYCSRLPLYPTHQHLLAQSQQAAASFTEFSKQALTDPNTKKFKRMLIYFDTDNRHTAIGLIVSTHSSLSFSGTVYKLQNSA